jgi:ribosomal protein L11 methyltransferase
MPEYKWLEVSLVVDGEYAEAAAEVLARYTPGGVVIESTHIAPDPEGEGTPAGPLRVRAFLPIDEHLEEKKRAIEEGLWYLSRIRPETPLPPPEYSYQEDVNWVEAWKQHYQPIEVGKKLVIVPAWMEVENAYRIPLRINPGMAFGTGTHPTTRLCLEMVEDYLQPEVIDVGCGSGILSIAALKLGAQRALGIDIDPEALPSALENAGLNGVEDSLELGIGSLAEIRSRAFSIDRAPLVLANILAPVLVKLLSEGLAEIIKPGGVLVMSGILEDQWQGKGEYAFRGISLQEAAAASGLTVIELRQDGDWIAVAAERTARRKLESL